MPQVVIVMEMDAAEAAGWQEHGALVVPLAFPAEPLELKKGMEVITSFVRVAAKALPTLVEVIETKGCDPAAIEKTIAMMREPARQAVDLSKRMEELLAAGSFIDTVGVFDGLTQINLVRRQPK